MVFLWKIGSCSFNVRVCTWEREYTKEKIYREKTNELLIINVTEEEEKSLKKLQIKVRNCSQRWNTKI